MRKSHKRLIEYRVYSLPDTFPIMVLGGDHWQISDVKSDKLHFHNCLEVGLCHTDSGTIEFEDKPIPFKAGDVTVVSRNILHTSYSSPGEKSLWTYLFMEPERLIPPYLRQSLEKAEMLAEIEQNICNVFSSAEYPQIHFYAEMIAKNLQNAPLNYQTCVRSLCVSFMIELMRIYLNNSASEKDRSIENILVIAPALDYVQENYSQQFKIDRLADACNMSFTHFRRIFGEIMHCAPLEFLHRTRILHARSLLLSTNMSVLEVSERVGYVSISGFNRHFLRETGQCPTEWRRSNLSVRKQNVMKFNGWTEPEKL